MEILAIVLLILGSVLMAVGVLTSSLYVLLCSAVLYLGCVIATRYGMYKMRSGK